MSDSNNYEILELIGQGSFGKVYRAIDIINRQEVAIKRLQSSIDTDQEVENHRSLNHLSCVPELLGVYNDDIDTYIVQQLIQGDSLDVAWVKNHNCDGVTEHLCDGNSYG